MADDATISMSVTILPDEIAKTISGSMTVTPDDVNDKWYYKLTEVTTTSADLIAGYFLDYTAVDQDTAPAANNLADGIFIGPSQSWFGRLPNATVADIHAISSDIGDAGDASATCIVAALLDDVGQD